MTPTTTTIQILRHAERRGQPVADGVQVVTGSAPLLRDIHIVDTPGTNAITREHETLTERFVPRADLILFVTSADRPFTESERQFIGAHPGVGQEGGSGGEQGGPHDLAEADLEEIRSFVSSRCPESALVPARAIHRLGQDGP